MKLIMMRYQDGLRKRKKMLKRKQKKRLRKKRRKKVGFSVLFQFMMLTDNLFLI